MPAVKCKCGAETNSALSEYWTRQDWKVNMADGCYVKWVNDHWEKGCLYEQTPKHKFMRIMADKMLKEEPNADSKN